MFRKFLLAVGLAGSAYQLYNNMSKESKDKVAEFIHRVTSRLHFRDLVAIAKR